MGAAYLQKTFVKGVRGKRLKNDGTLPTILIENNHPAIVTKEVWLAANEKLKQKAPRLIQNRILPKKWDGRR